MYTAGSVGLRPCLVIIGFFWSALANADSAPEAPAAECRAEQAYLEQIQGFSDVSPQEENFACFQSLEEADLTRSLIVDIRPQADFGKVRIPGSINLSQSELLTTAALKSRPLLVVDKGFLRTELAQLCAKAQGKGFRNFRILLGGVAAWHGAGKPLEGLPQHFAGLHTIEPRELLVEAQRNRVSVLATAPYVEHLKKITPPELIVRTLIVRTTDTQLSTDRQLISHLQQAGSNGLFPTVLLGANELSQQNTPAYRSVFTLEHSVQQLESAYRDHLAMVKKRQTVPERYRCRG